MGKKSDLPLEGVKLRLFEGDFAKLSSILKPRRVSATVFIRHIVRKAIVQIEAHVNMTAKPVEIDADELLRDEAILAESNEPGELTTK